MKLFNKILEFASVFSFLIVGNSYWNKGQIEVAFLSCICGILLSIGFRLDEIKDKMK